MKRTIIILITLITAYIARADYHYASHEGSNEYPYTSWATGAHRIQDAIDAAASGDTVFVGSGTWNDTTEIITNSLSLIGMGMDSTIWENIPEPPITNYADTTLIEGFSFVADYHINGHPGISCYDLGQITVKNNYFTGYWWAVAGNFGGSVINNIFEENYATLLTVAVKDNLTFANNTMIHEGHSVSIWMEDRLPDSSNIHIRNNLFFEPVDVSRVFRISSFYLPNRGYVHNNVFYRKIFNYSASYSVFGETTDGVIFYNNTIDGTCDCALPSTISAIEFDAIVDTTLIIKNNIIINCDEGIDNQEDIPAVLSYNVLFNVDVIFDGPGILSEGNIFTDPMFMDTSDFHLQAYSPAIDAGDPNILDVDGTRSDIGAYGGPYGCSYTYLDLAPMIPDSISAFVDTNMITLEWAYNYEADFNRYQVYRDTVPGFEPSIFDIIAEPDTSYYEDTDIIPGTPYYYRLTSVDNQGNISDFSEEIAVLPTSAWDIIEANLPYEPRITSAYPNPFNSNIVIVYSASNIGPQPPQITLKVYDIQGRVVKTLVDERKPQGTHRAVWDGTNDYGEKVASGTYIARVAQWGCPAGDFPVKITLLK